MRINAPRKANEVQVDERSRVIFNRDGFALGRQKTDLG